MNMLAMLFNLSLAAAPAQAAPSVTALEVVQPWSRPAALGGTGAGFMDLVNRGRTIDTLVAVESPFARRVQMHRSIMSGSVMSMQRQQNVVVPAAGSVRFAPGGYHLMFMGLKRPLKAGDSLPATLTFASGAKLNVSFAVGSGGPAPAPAHVHAH